MELLQKTFPGTLKRYWRRRQYQRLNGEVVKSRKNVKVTRIGAGSRRFWRVKAIPKLRWKIASPVKLLTKLKNAYVNMMISLAGNVGSLNTENTFGGKRIPKARQVPVVYSSNEFDQRLVYEIYKALVATRELSAG
ncbi:hypothetical protein QUC31_017416 [Theobroma cacao]|uniref:Uncharacterized protein LOC18601987 n=2 Tax=Theobroma cacao TaxID=3641 RepID=A0AB32V9P5_THECC|nr:PREDICTED: uncharacterized protein LOC18601987 [Theobroma cacao]EOY04092.1 Uncharacterized protein TCM_019359 [Theobroma cacao]WRX20656.1 hypothetical protein QQP08_013143 [Theobroma cacao]